MRGKVPQEKGNLLYKFIMLVIFHSKGYKWIFGPLPSTTSGNRFLLVVIDCFTKWIEAFPLKNCKVRTVAEVFVNQLVFRHEVPLEQHTNQDRNFESKIFRELIHLLGIRKTRPTVLHPQFDGHVI